jgi:hypothetical protein
MHCYYQDEPLSLPDRIGEVGEGGGCVRPLAIYVALRALLWPVSGPLTGPRVVFPGRPDWLLLLLFLLSPGLPRLDLPVVTLPLVVPVLRSVHRQLCAPMFPLSVLPHRAAAPLLVIPRDALFAPLCLYPPVWLLGFGRTRN